MFFQQRPEDIEQGLNHRLRLARALQIGVFVKEFRQDGVADVLVASLKDD